MNEKEIQAKLTRALKSLADFNILTEHIVKLIGVAFERDTIALCKAYGITYTIPNYTMCGRCGNKFWDGVKHVCEFPRDYDIMGG